MSKIKNIVARQILDSRGNPTVEVDVITDNGCFGRASAPSGASTGIYEALEIRDKNFSFYNGNSVQKAINNIHVILKNKLIGLDVCDQVLIDRKMIEIDGSENKSNIGANAILPISLAVSKAAARVKKIDLYDYLSSGKFVLPVPMMNILNGGAHADNDIDFQEFMIIPNSAKTFSQALRMGAEVFYALKNKLKSNKLSTNVGDEGGFAPNIKSNENAIELVLSSITAAGYKIEKDISIAIDAAASEFYDKEKKIYCFGNNKLTASEMVDFWTDWINKYPIVSIEDALDEDDWFGWSEMTKKNGGIQLVGDDLFVTNPKRLQYGIDQCVGNSILIKLNQIGTLTETLETIRLAKHNNYTTIISHRSGETEDVTIADLSVGSCAGQIKTGSISRSDRVGKYNQLLRIEEALGEKGLYLGFPEIKK
ncbi:MAG: phosphopyruvate hydratase [Flavobacteriales bacterium]|jgi:enolase|nr:phosphopyruvate hydratase [Flavobacteriales bacterium]|tara:strand:- start:420 stop:1691 length:1272 start_codon:yes stop_codon:yes gene_type:complete